MNLPLFILGFKEMGHIFVFRSLVATVLFSACIDLIPLPPATDDLLLAAVREKSYVSAMRHLSLEKRGAVWNHSVEKDGEGYIFHCSIRDRDGVAFHLDLRADSYPQAERMRMNFEDKPDVVYRGIVAMVTGNVNYLFEK